MKANVDALQRRIGSGPFLAFPLVSLGIGSSFSLDISILL